MKHGVYRWVAICLGLCIFTAAPVRAGIPPALVEQTVRVLVSRGATRSPALVKAVTDYYVQVASRSGAALKPTVEKMVVLEHAQKFVTSNPGLFSPAEAKQLQDKLTNDLNRALSTRQEVLPLGTALERAAQQATVGAEFKISVPDHMITGEQIINQFVRHWRQELFGQFTKEQLDAVEEALNEEQFGIELRAILEERGLSLTERQWKHIFGGKGQIFAPLAIPLKMLSTECYVAAYGKIPAQKAADAAEKSLGKWNDSFKMRRKTSDDPFVQNYIKFLNDNTQKKCTPQENLSALQAFLDKGGELSSSPSAPGCRFYNIYQRYQKGLERGIYTEQEKEATQDFVGLFEENWERQLHTPQENLADLQAFLDKGGELSSSSYAPGGKFYKAYRGYQAGLEARTYTGPEKEAAQAYVKLFEENWDRQILHTPSENLVELQTFLGNDGELSSNWYAPGGKFYQASLYYQKGLKADTYTGQEKEAAQAFVKLFEENWDRQILHTPQENLAALQAFLDKGGELSSSPSAPGGKFYQAYRRYQKGLEAGTYTGQENEAAQNFVGLFKERWERKRSVPKTLEEVYDAFLNFLKKFKTYPKTRGETKPLYNAVYSRMHNPQPENPTWQKLKRLDELARAAQRGEKPWERFDQAEPLKRPRVGAKQEVQITPEEKQILQEVEKNYEELYENFPDWVQTNHRYFVTTYNTVAAFNTLERQARVERMTENMSDILDTLNEMDLGPTEEGFNRVIFRGENPSNPKPTDFHVVSESIGIPAALSRRAVASMPQHIQVRLNDKTGDLDTLFLQPGVTEDEIRTVIENIRIPEGWQIRMGNHEIGFTDNGGLTDKARNGWIHLHIETVAAETEEEMYDLSYILQINTKALIEGKNEAQIRGLYKRLFRDYYRY